MYVISTFEHSAYLEMAIGALVQRGIPKEHILTVPLDKRAEPRRIMDTMHYSDGTSVMDGTFLTSTFFGALGTIFGFSLTWGPVIWGLIGFLGGGILGFAAKYWFVRRSFSKLQASKAESEVVVTVFCQKSEAKEVEATLWTHFALGVARLNLNPQQPSH